MSIELNWYVPSRIIYMHVHGEVEIEDIRSFGEEINTLLNDSDSPVHILLDDAEAAPPPANVREVVSALQKPMEDKEKIGFIVGIGKTNAIGNFVVSLVLNIMRFKYSRVENLDEALIYLSKKDLTLLSVLDEKIMG